MPSIINTTKPTRDVLNQIKTTLGALQWTQPASAAALFNNLIAHWRLEELSGERKDAIGTNHLADINTVGQAEGRLGKAASFGGPALEEALSIADNAALSMGDIDFTIAGWARFDTLGPGGLVSKWQAGSLEYMVFFNGAGLEFHVSANGVSSVSVISNTAISVGNWYLFVAWHDTTANTINISVNDGVSVSLAHSTGVHNGVSAFHLGRAEFDYFTGRLDSVSIWKRALTPSERTQLYNGGAGLDFYQAAAFGKVEIFDMTDLGRALNELLMLQHDRVCLIVLATEQWRDELRGRHLHCQQVRNVTLVMADRHWADRQKALMGDYVASPPSPGALTLKDITLPHVCGLLMPGIRCEPDEGDPGGISREREVHGRTVFFQNLILTGGELAFDLGKAPIV